MAKKLLSQSDIARLLDISAEQVRYLLRKHADQVTPVRTRTGQRYHPSSIAVVAEGFVRLRPHPKRFRRREAS